MLTIELKEWRVTVSDNGEKKIAGTYHIMNGSTEVAKQAFNDGYGAIDIVVPPSILVEVLKLDDNIKTVINKHYGLTESNLTNTSGN